MKAFISSVITGFEDFRTAVSEAAANLDCDVLRAEDFSALPNTPERACLEGVRDADVLLLILGQRYGAKVQGGLSPTHQEYREAKSKRTVLAFVQRNIEPEPEQAAFIKEVQEWNEGRFTASFSTAKELTREVTRALKNLLVSSALAPPDAEDMIARADALVVEVPNHNRGSLVLGVAGGPRQQVIEPSDLESVELKKDIERAALFDIAIFRRDLGTTSRRVRDSLLVEQEGASVTIDEFGSVRIVQPLVEAGRRGAGVMIPVVDPKDVTARMQRGLRFVGFLLDRVDRVRRITHVGIAAVAHDAGFAAWLRDDASANHNFGVRGGQSGRAEIVHPAPASRPRAALDVDADKMARQITEYLRRRAGD